MFSDSNSKALETVLHGLHFVGPGARVQCFIGHNAFSHPRAPLSGEPADSIEGDDLAFSKHSNWRVVVARRDRCLSTRNACVYFTGAQSGDA